MNKKISVERLYSLGDFKNIKFYDEISDIPENVALNEKAMSLLHFLQLLEIESSHKKYLRLGAMLPARPEQIDAAIELIENERSRTFVELTAELYKPIEATNKKEGD
jgi:hypothetical protein